MTKTVLTKAELEQIAESAATKAIQLYIKKHLPEPQYLDTRQASRYIGMSTSYLEIMRVKGGALKFCKLNQAVRYKREHLDEFMLKNSKNNTSQEI